MKDKVTLELLKNGYEEWLDFVESKLPLIVPKEEGGLYGTQQHHKTDEDQGYNRPSSFTRSASSEEDERRRGYK